MDWPFCWYGPEPKLFDGPFRSPDVKALNWSARSFLAYVGGDVTSRTVVPLMAFEWGFTRTEGRVSIKKLESLEIEAWDEHVPFLDGMFHGWSFAKASGDSS